MGTLTTQLRAINQPYWEVIRDPVRVLMQELYLMLPFRRYEMWDTANGRNLRQVRAPAETERFHTLT